MKKKMGRPQKYDRAMTEMYRFAVTPEQKEAIDNSGTADFWRPVMMKIAQAVQNGEPYVFVPPNCEISPTGVIVSTPPAEQG